MISQAPSIELEKKSGIPKGTKRFPTATTMNAAVLQTRFGRAIRLIGAGAGLTQRPRLLFWAYVFAGVGAAIGGIFLAAEVGAVDTAAGAPFLLQILAAAALGGSAPGLRGGTILGSLLGARLSADILRAHQLTVSEVPEALCRKRHSSRSSKTISSFASP
jgi:ribose/xylose/arabinose/galactoside ABC-type transport system permease subunit